MIINVDISPKALRETLCIAQTRIGNSGLDEHRRDRDIANLQALINECDRHRPLGPDGTHGDRHTPTCGCQDVPPPVHLFGPDAHGRPGYGRFPDSCGWPNEQCIGHAPRGVTAP